MTVVPRLIAAGVVVAGAALAAAPPALGAVVSGAVTDPGGGKHPAGDIRGVMMSYDQAGTVSGVVTAQAPPVDPAVAGFSFLAGTASKRRGSCSVEFEQRIQTVKPNDEISPFGRAFGKGFDLGDTDAQQIGLQIRFSTATGNFESGPRGNEPRIAGRPWNCAVVESYGPGTHREGKRNDVYDVTDVSAVFPLVAGPPQNCTVSRRTSRGRVRIGCTNVAGRVTVRLYRKEKLRKTLAATVQGGRLALSARGLKRRREYSAAVWQGPTMIGVGNFRRR